MNKKYVATIRGKSTDEGVLREILGDEFELVSLESETVEVTKEQQLIQTRKEIWSYLSNHTKLNEVEQALGKDLDRALCNEVLKEIKDCLEGLSDDIPMETTPTHMEIGIPAGKTCEQCGKANAKVIHEGDNFCDLMCVHKYIHS